MPRTGRPKIEIKKDDFEKLCGLLCTQEEIATWFKCSIDTLNNWCKKNYGKTFSESYKVYSVEGKISLRRMQFKLAEKSYAMAIWLGKQYLGQKDYVEDEQDKKDREIQVNISIEDCSDDKNI